MGKSSRRGFLKAATGTAAALTFANRMPAWAQGTGPVKVWSTYRDRRHVQGESIAWKPARQVAAEARADFPRQIIVSVDERRLRQHVCDTRRDILRRRRHRNRERKAQRQPNPFHNYPLQPIFHPSIPNS